MIWNAAAGDGFAALLFGGIVNAASMVAFPLIDDHKSGCANSSYGCLSTCGKMFANEINRYIDCL